jgi:hypothetical protein
MEVLKMKLLELIGQCLLVLGVSVFAAVVVILVGQFLYTPMALVSMIF